MSLVEITTNWGDSAMADCHESAALAARTMWDEAREAGLLDGRKGAVRFTVDGVDVGTTTRRSDLGEASL